MTDLREAPNRSKYNGVLLTPTSEFEKNEFLDTSNVVDGIAQNQHALYNHSFQTRLNINLRNPITFAPPETSEADEYWKLLIRSELALTQNRNSNHVFFVPPALYAECCFWSSGTIGPAYVALTFNDSGGIPEVPVDIPTSNFFQTTSSVATWHQLENEELSCISLHSSNYSRTAHGRTKDDYSATTTNVSDIIDTTVNVWVRLPVSGTVSFGGLILREIPTLTDGRRR